MPFVESEMRKFCKYCFLSILFLVYIPFKYLECLFCFIGDIDEEIGNIILILFTIEICIEILGFRVFYDLRDRDIAQSPISLLEKIPVKYCSCSTTISITKWMKVSYPKMKKRCFDKRMSKSFFFIIGKRYESIELFLEDLFIRWNMVYFCSSVILYHDFITIFSPSSFLILFFESILCKDVLDF